MASINAEPMMPKVVSTSLATSVSTNASLGVMRVIEILLSFPAGLAGRYELRSGYTF